MLRETTEVGVRAPRLVVCACDTPRSVNDERGVDAEPLAVSTPQPEPAAKRKRPWWQWVLGGLVALFILGALFGEDDQQTADRQPATTTPAPRATTTATTASPTQTIGDARAAVDAGDYREAVTIAREIGDASVPQIRRRIANRIARRALSALRVGDRRRAQRLLGQAERYPTTALTRRARADYRAARARAAQRAQARRDAAAQRRRDAAARRAAEQAAQAPPPPPQSGGCDANYSGCVPAYPPDVNCPEVAGPVDVLGSDPHGLDRDNDGVACE